MNIMRTNNQAARPLLRGAIVSVGTTWYPGPGADEEHRSCVLAVWCPWCRRFHFHGWDPRHDGRVAEHRCAHCADEASPFYRGGYYISVWRQSDPESKGHVVQPGKAISRKLTNERTIQ